MHVLFVTPEAAPLAKVGGLADVAASLPRALARLGHRVSVALPLYGTIDRAAQGVQKAAMADLTLDFDGRERRVKVFRARHGRVTFWLLENEPYFGTDAVYGDPEADAFRFAFFSRASLALSRRISPPPDVLHVHDWPTALLPVYQELDAETPSRACVLTIHNLAHQGVFPRAWLPRLGLPERLFHVEGLEFYGRINFLKGGLLTADRLTTVSRTYAREIQTPELGAGLDGVLRARASSLEGIRNGIDPARWHPGTDPALAAHYSASRPAGKTECKRALQRELGLSVEAEAPLLAAIGRLDHQKGFDLLRDATSSMLSAGAQLVVLGSGDEALLEAFRRWLPRRSRALSVQRGFQDELGRRIYAGADLFLMPSRYEPCGLGQMIALRFGTLPVVRATGGLADTIRDLDADPRTGNGFVFEEPTGAALAGAVARAIDRYHGDRARWKTWVRRAMREDFSWGDSARRYVEVYEKALSGPNVR